MPPRCNTNERNSVGDANSNKPAGARCSRCPTTNEADLDEILMRIALSNAIYSTPKYPKIFGGAEVFVRQLAEQLVECGNEVIVIRFSPSGSYESEIVNGVTVHFVPVRNLFPPFENQKNPLLRTAWHLIDDWQRADARVGSILTSFKPDILHSNTLNGLTTDVWRAAKSLKIPVLHTLHDYYLICPRCSRFKRGQSCENSCGACSLLTIGRRRNSSLVDAVVGVSQRTLDLHVNNGVFTAGSVKRVVRNAPNPSIAFTPQPEFSGLLTVGYLGRFSEEKGVRLLAEAANLLPAETLRLKLAGNVTDDEKSYLKALAPQVDLEFVGFVDPSDFYSTVDVVTIPSIWEEPSGLALIDALAAGRPVLATSYGGIGELVEDGVTGWIAEPDAASFALKLGNLAENPHLLQQVHQALSQRKNRRTLADMVSEYRQIYQSVLDLAPAALAN